MQSAQQKCTPRPRTALGLRLPVGIRDNSTATFFKSQNPFPDKAESVPSYGHFRSVWIYICLQLFTVTTAESVKSCWESKTLVSRRWLWEANKDAIPDNSGKVGKSTLKGKLPTGRAHLPLIILATRHSRRRIRSPTASNSCSRKMRMTSRMKDTMTTIPSSTSNLWWKNSQR